MLKINPHLTRHLAIIVFLLFTNPILKAENLPNFKFGKISKQDLEISKCEIDTSAHAFYMFDTAISEIDYNTSVGFQIRYNRHCAIKILTKSGYEYADFKIPVYKSSNGGMEEQVTKIKAVTYNMEGGKINETALNKKDIFKESENENWTNFSFTLPNVVEGSIIEVEYSITSDFLWNLPSWNFQHDIPVKWSILEVKIPEYFNYAREMKGYIPLSFHETHTDKKLVNFVTSNRTSNGNVVSNDFQNNQINFVMYNEIFASQNVPAFKKEPYIDAIGNYISTITFELKSTNFPSETIKNYTTTWEEIAKKLMDDSQFGAQINAVGSAKDIVSEMGLQGMSESEKAAKIFDYVKSSTKWDGRYSKYCDNVKQVIKSGVGTSGEINFMLINLLNAANLEARPLVLKTRYSGRVPFIYPSLSSMDYVIAAVITESGTFLLDATEKEIPFNFLPERCINEKGLLIQKDGKISWIELADKNYSRAVVSGEWSILENGEMSMNLNNKTTGHFAYLQRKSLDKSKEEIIKDFEKENEGFLVENYEINNLNNYQEILIERIKGSASELATMAGDMIYFSPCLNEKYTENPFKIEERKYPVDFAYPWENKITFIFTVPENWKVESVPENISMKMENDGGRYTYVTQQTGDKLIFSQTFSISKSIFLPEEYKDLKEFFKQVVAKQQEQIILKKI